MMYTGHVTPQDAYEQSGLCGILNHLGNLRRADLTGHISYCDEWAALWSLFKDHSGQLIVTTLDAVVGCQIQEKIPDIGEHGRRAIIAAALEGYMIEAKVHYPHLREGLGGVEPHSEPEAWRVALQPLGRLLLAASDAAAYGPCYQGKAFGESEDQEAVRFLGEIHKLLERAETRAELTLRG